MKAYFISGLGADERAFSKINLPTHFTAEYINWIPPQKNESLENYAERLAEVIDPSSPFILIGLSMGGMIAAEIARKFSPQKLILISSVSNRNELPWYFKAAGKLRLHKLIPITFFRYGTILNSVMGARSKEHTLIVKDFVNNTDPKFIKWALNAILNWKQTERLPITIHIHGTADMLLPVRYVKADHLIKKGKHLAILENATAINEILEKELSSVA